MLLLQKLYKTGLFSVIGIFRLMLSILNEGVNLMTLLAWASRMKGKKLGAIDETESLSYLELYHQSLNLAKNIKNDYLHQQKSKVAVIGYNHLSMLKSIFALSRCGADVYLLNVEIKKDQFDRLFNRFKFDLIIIEDELKYLTDDTPLSVILMSETSDLAKKECKSKLNKAYGGNLVVLTGGSTGDPKPASRKPSLFTFLNPFFALLSKVHLDKYNSVYIGTPIYHGFGVATVFSAMALCATLYLRKKFEASAACSFIRDHKIEVLTLVPLMLKRMLLHAPVDLNSVRAILTGAAPLRPDEVQLSQKILGDRLFNLYGTSEAGFCIMATPEDLKYDVKTIGKPVQGVKLHILDNNDQKVSTLEIGRLCVKARWSVNKTAYIETGDLGYRDKMDYIFLCGRTDDMIVSGGVNVYPLELENILLQHQDLEKVVVLGIPDEEFGQRLKAVIHKKSNSDINEERLRSWLKTKCTRYQMPKIIEFKDIEFSEFGKVNKKKL